MLVVSDTTAITTLLKIGRAELLPRIFDDICIPNAVRDELLAAHSEIPKFLSVRAVRDSHAVEELRQEIDAGEAEAIILAVEVGADSVMIDEKRGRALASSRGLRCIGLAGALLVAKRKLLIPALAPILVEMEAAGFYLDPHIKQLLLKRAAENAD